jgi:hypothetical protein
MNLQKV